MLSGNEVIDFDNDDEEFLLPETLQPSQSKHCLQIKSFIRNTLNYCLPGDDIALIGEDTGSGIIFLRKVLLPSVLESIVVMSIAGAASVFLEPNINWYEHPLFVSSIYMSINFLLRIPSAYTNTELFQRFSNWSHISDDFFRRIFRLVRSILFGPAMQIPATLIHEGGHALMALSLFKNASPKITLKGALSSTAATTSYNHNSGLTSAGQPLGHDNSMKVIEAMGTGSVVIASNLCLVAAQVIPDNYPEIRSHLRSFVFFSLMIELIYELSAFVDCSTSAHDFCKLKNSGLSPMIFVSIMLGFTLCVQAALSGISYCRDRLQRQEQERLHYLHTEIELDDTSFSNVYKFG